MKDELRQSNLASETEIISDYNYNKDNIIVSICCITYNHEKFIKDALHGFLFQKTNFAYEILIHDDASTDNTANIVREYEQKYPNIIKPIYQTVNQKSKYKSGMNPRFNYPRARGKYIALCDGDDYWTDPKKLQKQVDFLERHPAYVLCCGGYESLNPETGERKTEIETRFMKDPDGFSFTLLEMSISWFTKTLTSVFRSQIVKQYPEMLTSYRYCRDVHLFYHLMKAGKGFYFNEVFGVYRIHPGGTKSMAGDRYNKNIAYARTKELYKRNRDHYTRALHLRSVTSLLKYNLRHRYPENSGKKNIEMLLTLIRFVFTPGLMWHFIRAYAKTL